MVINNVKIVTLGKVIDNGHIIIKDKKIINVNVGPYIGNDSDVIDGNKYIAFPGFIDVHLHGASGIDFMTADSSDYSIISDALYQEGVTSYLATTLTSDKQSLVKVCENVKEAKKYNPSLLGIHFEGPYISRKYKGAQNENFIRKPDIDEFDYLYEKSGKNIKYMTLAVEIEGSKEFLKHLSSLNVVSSVGHSDATFKEVEAAIEWGLTNVTHTHNAMSGHDHHNPGVVSAAMHFDNLFTEVICDGIHVNPDALKTFYKIVGPDRFILITDSLKIKHTDINEFSLFGLDCIRKNGAAYLLSGPLAGSLLTMNDGLKNLKKYIPSISLIELMKVSSYNASKSLHLSDRGLIKETYLADIVLLDDEFNVKQVYKEGVRVK